MNDLRAVKGCKDLFDHDVLNFRSIIAKFEYVAKLYGCSEFYTPILEQMNVFVKNLGDCSDVVTKEMYSFIDQGSQHLALRPEFTAGIMRAVFSNSLQNQLPLRLFSYGPLFRRERPQSGRQRQFHQLNIEFLGFNQPWSDAEVINLGVDVLNTLCIDSYQLEINSLGCGVSRGNYQNVLREYFYDNKNLLSEISKTRLEKNPMRILDSKEAQDQELIINAPKIDQYYTDTASQYFGGVLECLDLLKIPYIINPRIVRGLDYYSHTAFEFIAKDSRLALIAGGRYDGLSQNMGNLAFGAVGFAAGIERLMMLSNQKVSKIRPLSIIPLCANEQNFAMQTAVMLRNQNINCLVEGSRKLSDALTKMVKKHNPRYVIILGSNEVSQGVYMLKDMDLATQEQMSFQQMINILKHDK